ncbi:hypothetical protein V2J09_001142, partial [Rumex salicifolius]
PQPKRRVSNSCDLGLDLFFHRYLGFVGILLLQDLFVRMGTELVRACIKEDDFDFPTAPPGFERYTPFKSKKVENAERDLGYSVVPNLSQQEAHSKVESNHNDSRKIPRARKRRSQMDYGQCCDSNDASGYEQLDQKVTIKNSLPKGVIRGCAECKDCQKVVARYKPEASSRPNIEEAPVFYPTEEEFKDTISYIGKIRPQAEPYGICRIVPPSSWKPPCPLQKKSIWENSKFATRVQRVDKLQNREPTKKTFSNHTRKKRRRCSRMGTDIGAENGNILVPLEFGFEPGPEFTLDAFQRYADQFKDHYFRDLECDVSTEAAISDTPGKWYPPIEVIEGEYWRVVENPTEEIEVLYGADLETGAFGSGFPRTIEQASSSDEQYIRSGWNLNNLPRVPGSVLTYESTDISGVQIPWLYVGMCFSSFCWHVEDHYLYSLNYMHFGAPKMWYGVPGKDATKLEEAMRKHLPDLFDEQPDLLHKLVTQLSPTIVKSEGVPVYRCVQSPGEFVITFPRAYHGGFNCGFNCAEAVNVAPLDWFPHGQNAVELYREQRRKTTISHDKLLVGAAIEAVKANWELNFLKKHTADNLKWKNVCGDGILAKSLKARVDMEHERRDFLSKSSHVLKMVSSFDAATERECSVCFFDLHLSAVGCRCSPDRYACLNHAKQMCPCDGCDKYFLFRYETDELDLLVEAIQGKLSAVYRWARTYLGLSLTTRISKDSKKDSVVAEIQPPKQASTGPPRLTFLISKKATATEDTKEVLTSHKFTIKKDVSKSSRPTIAVPEVKKSLLEHDVICLSDDEGEQLDNPDSGFMEEAASKPLQQPKVNQSNNKCRQASNGTKISSPMHDGVKNSWSGAQGVVIALGVQRSTKRKDAAPVHNKLADVASTVLGSQNSIETTTNKALGVQQSTKRKDATPVHNKVTDVSSTVLGSQNSKVADVSSTILGSQNSVEKTTNNHKGPRIAKVVRRINCNVEPLEFGSVVPGKLWSSSRAIFPKGFKSRMKYLNVLDPTNMCHYISQVLDWGAEGPLFMVSLEENPSEVFVHVTPTRCWEMVRERVNLEISKQHKLGKLKLPPLQPPGSSDGFELFGFTSPPIIQAIEALDRNRICIDYWTARPLARLQSAENVKTPLESKEAKSVETDRILSGLFKKANSEELSTLLGILGDDKSAADVSIVTSLLKDEIHRGNR